MSSRLVACAGHERQCQAADAGRALEAAADGVAGRHGARPSSGVGVVHELLQHAVPDEHVAAGGETLAVDVGGGVGQRVRRVVDQGDRRGRHLSPSRSLNRLRPLTTASPFSVTEMTPRNCAVTYGSSTTVRRRLDGFVAPSSRVARSAASRAAWSRSNSSGERPTLNPNPVCVSLLAVTFVGERRDRHVAAVLPARHPDAGGGRHRRLAGDVGVVRVVDAHPRVGAGSQLLEFLGEVDLAVGREGGQVVVPQRLSVTATPSGSASAAHSSSVPNRTLSRASASTSAMADASSVPA